MARTAKKAPAKKTVKAAARAPKVTVESDEVPTRASIEYQGRDIEIQLPGGAALSMYQRTMDRFGRLDPDDTEELQRLLGRLASMILGLFVHQEDKDWFEEGLLDQTLADQDLANMMGKVADQIGGGDGAYRVEQ